MKESKMKRKERADARAEARSKLSLETKKANAGKKELAKLLNKKS